MDGLVPIRWEHSAKTRQGRPNPGWEAGYEIYRAVSEGLILARLTGSSNGLQRSCTFISGGHVNHKRICRHINFVARGVWLATGIWPSGRALFRAGLISRDEYLVAADPGRWRARWEKPGKGRYFKRRLSKARRRAWKQRPRKALSHWESECNWKGT